MKKRVVFNLIVLFLNALSFAQVQEFQDDVIVEKIQNPRTSYLNAVIEPVVFTLFDEQFLLGGGLRFSAYHFVNRVSFEGGIERKYFNLESAYTKKKVPIWQRRILILYSERIILEHYHSVLFTTPKKPFTIPEIYPENIEFTNSWI